VLSAVLVLAIGYGLILLADADEPVEQAVPIALLLAYALFVASVASDYKSRSTQSAVVGLKVLGMLLCMVFLLLASDHFVYLVLALLVACVGCLRANEERPAASSTVAADVETGAGGGNARAKGAGKMCDGDDDVKTFREDLAAVGKGEDPSYKVKLTEAEEWVKNNPIFAFLAVEPYWDVSTSVLAFGFQLYGAIDDTDMTVVMLVAALVMATISVRKDYVARKRALRDQYFKRGYFKRAWATYKCHDMMMDFFTCYTGWAGLLYFLLTGKGGGVIRLLNLVSVLEDVVELLGASFSFCIGYSEVGAITHVFISNTLITFGSIWLLVNVVDSVPGLDRDTLIGCALCVVAGIATAWYGYCCCFAELAEFIDSAQQPAQEGGNRRRNQQEVDGTERDLVEHELNTVYDLTVNTGVIPSR
jgi:hypothetical protein